MPIKNHWIYFNAMCWHQYKIWSRNDFQFIIKIEKATAHLGWVIFVIKGRRYAASLGQERKTSRTQPESSFPSPYSPHEQ